MKYRSASDLPPLTKQSVDCGKGVPSQTIPGGTTRDSDKTIRRRGKRLSPNPNRGCLVQTEGATRARSHTKPTDERSVSGGASSHTKSIKRRTALRAWSNSEPTEAGARQSVETERSIPRRRSSHTNGGDDTEGKRKVKGKTERGGTERVRSHTKRTEHATHKTDCSGDGRRRFAPRPVETETIG